MATTAVAGPVCVCGASIVAVSAANAATDTFDRARPGALPADWTCGVTGGGTPKWAIEADASAPSPPNVLKQTGSGTFPWCLKKGVSITDGFVEVKFKPIDGREDRAGGIVWRWKYGNDYYIARANALEGNVLLYHTESGRKITIQHVDAPVAANQWYTLRVEFFKPAHQGSAGWQAMHRSAGRHIIGPAQSVCEPRRTA
jgi:hypothetical protein